MGFAIACRLISEFLQTRPESQSLVLILTTRTKNKGDDAVRQLQDHLRTLARKWEKSAPGIGKLMQHRVHIRNELLDLTSLVSVQRLAKKIRETTPKLDALILNAGIGGWEGLNWGSAIYQILTDTVNAVTYPTFKRSGVGWLTKPQLPPAADGSKAEEPPLGEVFCANTFGHYLLGHYLAPLLANHRRSEGTTGRIIWVSSLEAYGRCLDMDDIQSIESKQPYESSKRLTDVLAITSTLESTAPMVNQYLGVSQDASNEKVKPRIYVTHPGICGTTIVPLPWMLNVCMFLVFYVARLLGSPWHNVTAENGACSAVWVALAKQHDLDSMEKGGGVAKWGSASDLWGNIRVDRTEVDGWGWGGKVDGGRKKKGRHPYAKDVTEKDLVEFKETGRKCWAEMEHLREEWEKRLAAAGAAIQMD